MAWLTKSKFLFENKDCHHVPVFIGGFRSGSTLLINLLGLHPEITPWFETKSLCDPLRWMKCLTYPHETAFESRRLAGKPGSKVNRDTVYASMRQHIHYTADRVEKRCKDGKALHESYPIGADYIRYSRSQALQAIGNWRDTLPLHPDMDRLAQATGQLIRSMAAAQTADAPAFWINKTPEIIRFGHELRACVGRCKIIHLIRDGREVAYSAAKLGWNDIRSMATFWRDMIMQAREAALHAPEDYLEIRFEQLISHPAETLDEIFEFIDIQGSGRVLYKRYASSFHGNSLPGRASIATTMPWKDLQVVEDIAGNMLTELGYR